MTPALLLIDLQNDFLERENLTPSKDKIIQQTKVLLDYFRNSQLPVIHIQTLVQPNDLNRMPHWVESENNSCIEGSAGSQPPISISVLNTEPIIKKQFYSGFESKELNPLLISLNIDTVIMTGIYTHACIRSTALDAYQHGYSVWIAEDAIGSTEILHADLTKKYLSERFAKFKSTNDITSSISSNNFIIAHTENSMRSIKHYSPSDNHILLNEISISSEIEVDKAADQANNAFSQWSKKDINKRKEILKSFIKIILKHENEFIEIMVDEIGKPIQDCHEEFNRAIEHAKYSIKQFGTPLSLCDSIDNYVQIHYKPVGVVGLITPWNNPIAIPLSKIISALIFGNAVVWKPAHQATKTSQLIMEILLKANIPVGCVSIVFGDATTAQRVATHPLVNAITATGSISTGKKLASLCAMNMKPLQAELGGNNASIVMSDCDIENYINSMVMSSFSFSGQRCTAIRRFIVEESIKDKFISLFTKAISVLKIGYPTNKETQIGPLISSKHQQYVLSVINQAIQDGALLLHGGNIPVGFESGNWVEPTVLLVNDQDASIVQEEIFGPVTVIQSCRNFDDAMDKCNGVKQGLIANLYSTNPLYKEQFLDKVEAGVIRINPTTFLIHPEASFLGWKASGIGPAEHGRWEREFFTRPQSLYI